MKNIACFHIFRLSHSSSLVLIRNQISLQFSFDDSHHCHLMVSQKHLIDHLKLIQSRSSLYAQTFKFQEDLQAAGL